MKGIFRSGQTKNWCLQLPYLTLSNKKGQCGASTYVVDRGNLTLRVTLLYFSPKQLGGLTCDLITIEWPKRRVAQVEISDFEKTAFKVDGCFYVFIQALAVRTFTSSLLGWSKFFSQNLVITWSLCFFLLHHFRTWATTLLQYSQVLRIQVNLVQNFYYRVMAQVKKKLKKEKQGAWNGTISRTLFCSVKQLIKKLYGHIFSAE